VKKHCGGWQLLWWRRRGLVFRRPIIYRGSSKERLIRANCQAFSEPKQALAERVDDRRSLIGGYYWGVVALALVR
jgi:hypothetical protein